MLSMPLTSISADAWYLGWYFSGMAWTMRRGASRVRRALQQEITRDAVREYLMRHRRWTEPLVGDEYTFDMGGPIGKDDIQDAMNRPA
ncbi:hypothetical protein [Nocardia otitidiscaviarum]|nr:hypothetical protein [Nocardia otitidiscaviarum]